MLKNKFNTGNPYIAQAGLELKILPPHPLNTGTTSLSSQTQPWCLLSTCSRRCSAPSDKSIGYLSNVGDLIHYRGRKNKWGRKKGKEKILYIDLPCPCNTHMTQNKHGVAMQTELTCTIVNCGLDRGFWPQSIIILLHFFCGGKLSLAFGNYRKTYYSKHAKHRNKEESFKGNRKASCKPLNNSFVQATE